MTQDEALIELQERLAKGTSLGAGYAEGWSCYEIPKRFMRLRALSPESGTEWDVFQSNQSWLASAEVQPVKHPDCTVTVPHQAHKWYVDQMSGAFYECPGVFDRPTLDQACERIAAWLIADAAEVRELYGKEPADEVYYLDTGARLRKSDLVALLAAVGWGVTADQARTEPVPEPLFEVTE